MKDLLLLTEDQETMGYIATCYGLIFTAMELKTPYMSVAIAVVNSMKVILVTVYQNMHVKVSLKHCIDKQGKHLPNFLAEN